MITIMGIPDDDGESRCVGELRGAWECAFARGAVARCCRTLSCDFNQFYRPQPHERIKHEQMIRHDQIRGDAACQIMDDSQIVFYGSIVLCFLFRTHACVPGGVGGGSREVPGGCPRGSGAQTTRAN